MPQSTTADAENTADIFTPDKSPSDRQRVLKIRMDRQGPSRVAEMGIDTETLHHALHKVKDVKTGSGTSQRDRAGRIPEPFNRQMAWDLLDVNTYHSACLTTLTAGTIGGGLVVIDESAPTVDPITGEETLPPIDKEATKALLSKLDKLCEVSWHHTLYQIVHDYWNLGAGYLECQRDDDDALDAMYWVPGFEPFKYLPLGKDGSLSGDRRKAYWRLKGTSSGSTPTFVPWRRQQNRPGDLETFGGLVDPSDPLPELVVFPQASTRSDHYGYPSWLAGSIHIDLDVRSNQRSSDHHDNRGTPDCILVVQGTDLGDEEASALDRGLKSGKGRSIGSVMTLVLPDAEKDQALIHKIDLGSPFDPVAHAEAHNQNNLCVASSHNMPPVLAGITTPGKMAASNESVMALTTLQCGKLDQAQREIAAVLNNTICGDIGGVPGMQGRTVRFKTWMESVDIKALNVVARQREQTAVDPERDPKDGLDR